MSAKCIGSILRELASVLGSSVAPTTNYTQLVCLALLRKRGLWYVSRL